MRMVGFDIFAPAPEVQQDCEVLEENWDSVAFFADYCGTQWRVGVAGPTGLDYTAVIASLRSMRISKDSQADIFADVRVMEGAALRQLAEQREATK